METNSIVYNVPYEPQGQSQDVELKLHHPKAYLLTNHWLQIMERIV